jgi:hypothetical protein
MPYQGLDINPLENDPESKEPIKLDVNCPVGCHLQTINGVGGALNMPSALAMFDKLLKRGHGEGVTYAGMHFTGTLVSFSDNCNCKQTIEILEERGFKYMGSQPGAHGSYRMLLYGLGFTLPGEEKDKK